MDRSANMRAIRSKDMKPELAVRRLAHKLGYRYRVHSKDLPGKPDLVFRARRKVIFVNGCFWHAHNCPKAHTPKSNLSYWEPKLQRNKARDLENVRSLSETGWGTLIIWECEVEDELVLAHRLKSFLDEAPDEFTVTKHNHSFCREA